MRRAPKFEDLTAQQKQIHNLLCLFAQYSNTGLLPFFCEASIPDAETLYEMKLSEYIDGYKKRHHGATPENIPTKGGSGIPYAQRVVEVANQIHQQLASAGGIDTFKAAFEELTKTQPRNMEILRDLSRRTATLDTAETIAEKHYLLDAGSIYKIRKKLLPVLAVNISGRVKVA